MNEVEELVQEHRSDLLPQRKQSSLVIDLCIPVVPPTLTVSKLIKIRYLLQVTYLRN